MEDKPNYYAIIPANVRYDNKLSGNEKVMYSEITALSSKSGECWASNSYFARLYNVTPQAISIWLGNLQKQGYITIDYEYKGKQITKRTIRLKEVSIYFKGVSSTTLEGYQNIFKENNTSNNNTSINKIIGEYENEIGLMTPYQLEVLSGYLDDLSEEMIIEAIHIASSRNAKNLSYVEAILKQWINTGIKCKADIKEIKKENKKKEDTGTKFLQENGIESFDDLYEN